MGEKPQKRRDGARVNIPVAGVYSLFRYCPPWTPSRLIPYSSGRTEKEVERKWSRVKFVFQSRLWLKRFDSSEWFQTKPVNANGDPRRSFDCASGMGVGSKVLFNVHNKENGHRGKFWVILQRFIRNVQTDGQNQLWDPSNSRLNPNCPTRPSGHEEQAGHSNIRRSGPGGTGSRIQIHQETTGHR